MVRLLVSFPRAVFVSSVALALLPSAHAWDSTVWDASDTLKFHRALAVCSLLLFVKVCADGN
jgi:hypothetical protein